MKKMLVFTVLVCVSQASALNFSENFDSYAGGTLSWGSGGVWNEPTNNIALDTYAVSGLAPRVGNTANRSADAELGVTLQGPLTLEASFKWDHVIARADGFFVVLADSPATAALVPDTGALATPINAIAIGHAKTGNKNYGFFDGLTWRVLGAFSEASGTNHYERLQVIVGANGAYQWQLTEGEASNYLYQSTLAVSNFSFNTLSIQSRGGNSGYFSGIDDISLTDVPEPTSLALLGLGALTFRRRK